jgi:hypothetical protein
MGYWKNREIEQSDLRFSAPPGYFVCDHCVDDGALAALIHEHATETTCDFCHREADKPIAAGTDIVLERISEALRRYYDIPEAVLYFDSESESGYAGPSPAYMEDLVGEETFPCEAFAEFVKNAFNDYMWVTREPYVLSEREALSFSWRGFAHTVKHEARFLFALTNSTPDPYPDPGAPVREGLAFLDEIGNLVRGFGLVRELDPGVPLDRVRVCDPERQLTGAKDVGAPEADNASQNRMSPAGIPMVYCALDPETAVLETVECPKDADRLVWTAEFHVREPTLIVDLGLLPEVPSFFDVSESVERREKLRFLDEFHEDVSKPIERDERIHIEYVPTQVVTEYLRRSFRTADDVPVFGLQFASSRSAAGHNVVLFLDRDQCVDPGETAPSQPALELANLSTQPAREICRRPN